MNDKEMLKTIEFLETLRERFEEYNLTAINIRTYNIQVDNEFLLFWIEKNKDEFELISTEIRRTTREERIKNIIFKVSKLKEEIIFNKQKRSFLKLREQAIFDEIHKLTNQLEENEN